MQGFIQSIPDPIVDIYLRAKISEIEACVAHGHLKYLPTGHLGLTVKGIDAPKHARFGIERGKHDQTLTIANLHGELDDCRDLIRRQQSRISQLTNAIESMRTHNKDKHATIQSLRNDLDEMVRTHTIPSDEWMAKMFSMGE